MILLLALLSTLAYFLKLKRQRPLEEHNQKPQEGLQEKPLVGPPKTLQQKPQDEPQETLQQKPLDEPRENQKPQKLTH